MKITTQNNPITVRELADSIARLIDLKIARKNVPPVKGAGGTRFPQLQYDEPIEVQTRIIADGLRQHSGAKGVIGPITRTLHPDMRTNPLDSDTDRLDFLIALIQRGGSRSISNLPWNTGEDGDDCLFDRSVIDNAMKKSK